MQRRTSPGISPMIFPALESLSDSSTEAVNGGFPYSYSLGVEDRQDMINRHSLCLRRLRLAADEATSLRRENANLRSLNVEMNKNLRMILIQSSLAQTVLRREKTRPSLVATAGSERKSLPKSLSVKSADYPKTARNSSQNVKARVRLGTKSSVEIEVKSQGSFKTELCNKWQDTGDCPYGPQCQFAHGIGELRPVMRHPRYKTQLCRMATSGTSCPYGHRCHFLHAGADRATSDGVRKDSNHTAYKYKN